MSIEKRGKTFRVRLRKSINGKIETIFDATVDTLKEAKKLDAIKELEWDNGTLSGHKSSKHITLSDIMSKYAEEVTPKITNYPEKEISRINLLCARSLAGIKVSQLKQKHFATYRDERLMDQGKKGLIKRKTLKDELNLIRRIIEHAIEEWDIIPPAGNPINIRSLLKTVPNDSVKRVGLDRDDNGSPSGTERKLILACESYGNGELAHFVTLGLETAARRKELLSMRWENINIPKRIAIVHNKDTKKRTENQTRKVPLSSLAINALIQIGVKEEGSVFMWTNPDSVTKAMQRACERANITPAVTPHMLRHEAITRKQALGWTPAQISALSGHQTTQMHDNYGHIQAEDILGKLN